MSTTLAVAIAGIGVFTPGLPDWPAWRSQLHTGRETHPAGSAPPRAEALPATERRRAPEGVRLAAEVAAQACRMAACDPATLPSFFASAHGEAGITDYVCATLARAPLELSPTKFHNSVLNAAAGYWTIATGCTAASSAVSAGGSSVAAGLLEAAAFAQAERTLVMFAAYDVATTGPLGELLQTRVPFGMALVLGPDAEGTRVRLRTEPAHGAGQHAASAAASLRTPPGSSNPTAAQALPLLALLASADPGPVSLRLSRGLALRVERTA